MAVRVLRCVLWLGAVAFVLWSAPGAYGQAVLGPACGSAGGVGHGWVVVPDACGRGALLVHLPPREDPGQDGMRASPAGTGRVAARFESMPEAIAAVGDRVYVVFGATRDGGRASRFVGSLGALAGGVGDWWMYEPRDRLRVEASLPGEGVLIGFAGTPVGVAALIDRTPRELAVSHGEVGEGGAAVVGGRAAARPPRDLQLTLLAGGSWREVVLPTELVRDVAGAAGETGGGVALARRRFRLASSSDGVVVVAARPGRQATVWTAALTVEQVAEGEARRRAELRARRAEWERAGRPGGREPALRDVAVEAVVLEWTARREDGLEVGGPGIGQTVGGMRMVEDRLIGVQLVGGEGGENVLVWSVGPGGRESLGGVRALLPASAGGQAEAARVVGSAVLEASRRVVMVMGPGAEVGEGREGAVRSLTQGQMGLRVVEVSIDTGAVLYDGGMRTGAPLDRDDLHALLVVVVGAMGLMLVWVVRGQGGATATRMPECSALAPAGMRVMGGVIDLVVASAVTGWLIGAPLLEVMSLRANVGAPGSAVGWVLGLLALQGTGVAIGAVSEGLMGRSLGKAVLGMRVVSISGRGAGSWGGPGMARALVRNVVRWGLAPVALMGLLGRGDGRHVGDRMTGTAVVVRVEEEGGGEGA